MSIGHVLSPKRLIRRTRHLPRAHEELLVLLEQPDGLIGALPGIFTEFASRLRRQGEMRLALKRGGPEPGFDLFWHRTAPQMAEQVGGGEDRVGAELSCTRLRPQLRRGSKRGRTVESTGHHSCASPLDASAPARCLPPGPGSITCRYRYPTVTSMANRATSPMTMPYSTHVGW